MPGATISVTINTPASVVYKVVTDFDKYPEFLSETREVDVLEKNAKTAQVEFIIKVIKKIRYVLDYKLTRNKKIVWSFVEGDTFKDCKGSWVLNETQKGVTEATYHVEVDFGLFVPKKITEMLVGRNLPSLMQSFKDRAEGMVN